MLRRGGLGRKTGKDKGSKQCLYFPIMLSAQLAAPQMNLSVNQLAHSSRRWWILPHEGSGGAGTKGRKGAHANWLWGQQCLRVLHWPSPSRAGRQPLLPYPYIRNQDSWRVFRKNRGWPTNFERQTNNKLTFQRKYIPNIVWESLILRMY